MELEKINDFLSSWSKGVIEIGKIHREGGDYIKSAKHFLRTHYALKKLMFYLNQHLQKKWFLEIIKKMRCPTSWEKTFLKIMASLSSLGQVSN